MAAARTACQLGAHHGRVELVAADAVKRGLPALAFERAMVASIVPQPQPEKHDRDERAVNDGGGGEIEHARAGRKAHLIFKVNAIVDPRFIELLYQASQAGVKVDLLVRSMCCLKPGVKGVSDHVNVVSVV